MAKRSAKGKTPKEHSADEQSKAAPKKAAAKAAKKAAPVARKTAAKKSEATKPAVKKATKAAASPKKAATTRKPAAKKTAARKATARPAAAKQSQESSAAVASEPLASGVIRPRTRRPAAKHPVNGTLLYRQQRGTFAPQEPEEEAILPELPDTYGHTHIAALIRDSEWIFVYWEFTPQTRAEFRLDDREVSRALTLRLYDITGLSFDGSNAGSHVDVPINTVTSSWYLHVPEPGRAYVVEIGLMDGNDFRAISRSNEVEMPRHVLAETSGSEWSSQDEEAHRQILLLSGGPQVPLNLSSAEFVDAWNSRLLGESAGFSGVLFSGALPIGSSEQSSLAVRQRLAKGRERGFWLKVDAEVIVYGATDPKAKVRFMGRDVELGPDGTFGVRMALPDGMIEFPVTATSPDEQETREVCPVVSRRTK